MAESLNRGDRVIVQGRLKQRSYETKDGERRTVIELDVEEIGPSLRWVVAKLTKASRGGGGPAESPRASPPVPVGARVGGEPPF